MLTTVAPTKKSRLLATGEAATPLAAARAALRRARRSPMGIISRPSTRNISAAPAMIVSA